MKLIITKILSIAIQAPSGDNTQPWWFIVNKNIIYVHAKKIRGDAAWSTHTEHITHGTLIENICIVASEFGYRAELELLPDAADSTLTARITLHQASTAKQDLSESLFTAIEKRVTNRYSYKTLSLTENEKNTLRSSIYSTRNARLVFIEDEKTIGELSDSVVTQIKVFFSNQILHRDFFSRLRWSKKVALESPGGLSANTLALDPFTILSMHYLLSFWPIVKFLNLFNFSGMMALIEKHRRYKRSAAYCAIIVPNEDISKITYLQVGQDIQRVWLTATNLNLSIQPTAAVIIMEKSIISDTGFPTSPYENTLIHKSYLDMHKLCGANNVESVLWLMRIGHPTHTALHSPKKEPEITFIED